MKTLLITGGAGFIGSNFIRHMIQMHPNYTLLNVDKLTYAGNLENLTDVMDHKHYYFIKGDIQDKKLIKSLFESYEIDYIINFAAESHVDRSIHDPEIFVNTNILGTQILLDIAMAYWTIGSDELGYPMYREGVKYLQISTDEVYGTLEGQGMFTEQTPLSPNSPYSASKASADLLVEAYSKTFHLPVNITRCSNNYGPYQFPEKLIPLMILNVLSDKALPVYGDGLQIRDWIHVKDHCRAIDKVLHDGVEGEVYNIGGHNEQANIDIVKLIISRLDKDDSLITYVTDRLCHDRRYAIDNEKIKTLDWEPVYDFDQGMEETIQWYLDHKTWCDNVITHEYIQYYKKMYEDR